MGLLATEENSVPATFIQMMEEKVARDNSFLAPNLESVTRLRVTGLAEAEKCPAKWRAMFLAQPDTNPIDDVELGKPVNIGRPITIATEKPKTDYAMIGTAVHVIAENILGSLYQIGFDGELTKLAYQYLINECGPAEVRKIAEYFERLTAGLRNTQARLIKLEQEVEIPATNSPVPISGQVDAVFTTDGTNIIILDHKTNRWNESIQVWHDKFQPQAYALGIFKLYPDIQKVTFMIGRVQFKEDYAFDYPRSMVDAIQGRVDRAVANIFPANFSERVHPECRFCPRKDSCVAKNPVTTFLPGALHLKMISSK